MTKNLFYLTFIFVIVIALSNSANKCTQGEDGFMYCEDMSSQGQGFLKHKNRQNAHFLKKRKVSNACLNSENDPIYEILSGFDIFCFDEIIVSQSFNITGRIAAKNSINSGSVTINESYPQDCTNHDFKYAIYTDKLNFGDGQIHGGIHYGSLLNIKKYLKDGLISNKCTISNNVKENLNFDKIEKRVIYLSKELGKVVSNTKVEVHDKPNRRIVLSKDIKDYVIDVDENTFISNGGYGFFIENPDNLKPEEVTIIFNVKTKTFELSKAGFNMNGFGSRIIWNMPEVTEASFHGADIYGLLFAPKAFINLYNGNLYGKLVSKSFSTRSVSINNASFNVCVPNPKVRYSDETICNNEKIESQEINSDIVFIFDESKSMCKYVTAMKNNLQSLIDELNKINANTRFALIGFGGKPRIYSSFTSNINEINDAFSKLNCKQNGQESGLEAIRMFLKKSDKFLDSNNKEFNYDVKGLAWRSDSTKTIILVTDEDSDLPHYSENRNNLQNYNAVRHINLSNYHKKTLNSNDADLFVGYPYYGRYKKCQPMIVLFTLNLPLVQPN